MKSLFLMMTKAILLLGQYINVYKLYDLDISCSTYEMTPLVAEFCTKSESVFDIDTEMNKGYFSEVHQKLDTTKVRKLDDSKMHAAGVDYRYICTI